MKLVLSTVIACILLVAPASAALIYDDRVGAPPVQQTVPNLPGPTSSNVDQTKMESIPEPAAFGFIFMGLVAMIFIAGGGGRVNSVKIENARTRARLRQGSELGGV